MLRGVVLPAVGPATSVVVIIDHRRVCLVAVSAPNSARLICMTAATLTMRYKCHAAVQPALCPGARLERRAGARTITPALGCIGSEAGARMSCMQCKKSRDRAASRQRKKSILLQIVFLCGGGREERGVGARARAHLAVQRKSTALNPRIWFLRPPVGPADPWGKIHACSARHTGGPLCAFLASRTRLATWWHCCRLPLP